MYDTAGTAAADVVNQDHVGDRIRIMDISGVASSGPDDVVICDGATKVTTLSAKGKDAEMERASDGCTRAWEATDDETIADSVAADVCLP